MITPRAYLLRICRRPQALVKARANAPCARLNPRKMPSGQVPVFFDPRIAGGMIGALIGAINGASVARGTSFLKDKMGQKDFFRCDHDYRRPAPRARFAVDALLMPKAFCRKNASLSTKAY